MRDGDEGTLLKLGLGGAGTGALGQGRKPSVAVLVEGLEHGRELASRLPGWSLCHAGPKSDEESGDGAGGDGKAGAAAVVTAVVRGGNGRRADVVVLASGTGWPPG